MPINSIQYRAEIGIFYSIFQHVQNCRKINWFNYFCVEVCMIFSLIFRIGIYNTVVYSMCFLLTLIVYPILLVINLSFSNSLSIVDLGVASFSWIYFTVYLTSKVFNYIINNSKIITNFVVTFCSGIFSFFKCVFTYPILDNIYSLVVISNQIQDQGTTPLKILLFVIGI